MNTRPCCPPTPSDAACSPGPLSRPHFFAGQCLTEDDLNAMQHYLVQRQQRHNRFLHGVGVVNGLKVCSHPCPGWITIKAGFAIGPCGEEICVPEDYEFDLCSAIKKKCLAAAPCSDRSEFRWQIRIRYAETECSGTAPVALKSGKCGCGCQEKGKGAKSAPCRCQSPGPSPVVACQPSRIRECFEIDVVAAYGDAIQTRKELTEGTFVGAVMKCLEQQQQVLKTIYGILDSVMSVKAGNEWITPETLRRDVIEELSKAFCSWKVLEINNETRVAVYARRLKSYLESQFSMLSCICNAVLPSVNDIDAAENDDFLTLAAVTTESAGVGATCSITGICNLKDRDQLIGVPTLQYWASIIPSFWESLERLCCDNPGYAMAFKSTPIAFVERQNDSGISSLNELQVLGVVFNLLTSSIGSMLGGSREGRG